MIFKAVFVSSGSFSPVELEEDPGDTRGACSTAAPRGTSVLNVTNLS